MDIFAELDWRGLVHQTTDPQNLRQWLSEGSQIVYAGFDPTSDGLHVGNFVPLMMLRRFQKTGHRPIVLAGGATGMIGDPSGKSEERNLLSAEQIEHNLEGITHELGQFLDFDGPQAARLVNNYDWMKEWDYLTFLRDIGKHFPVNVMLGKESVKARLEETETGMSYTEFSYMLLQAYDFVHLSKTHGCGLQVGGSDQWGNITAGIELARRMGEGGLHGLTCPLLTKSDGTKMGKTEQGAIWLSPKKTSPYVFYQYWYNTEDADVDACLRMLTELSEEEITSLAGERANAPQQRRSQQELASSLTQLVHGDEGLQKANKASEVLFGATIEQMSDADLTDIFADVPSQELARNQLADGGLSIIEALCQSGLAKSKSDARRTVDQGGAYVNNRRVEDQNRSLTQADLASETVMVLRSGKKRYALLKFV
ncbi:MAG: tyrosine--tRNA ligase [Planctomycetota bacterium]|nr:tyrosine--tRNA ligase [Planctomycetota bacterium]